MRAGLQAWKPMIRQIAKKEIQHNLYSIRFSALMVISALLFILNGILAVTEPMKEITGPRPSMTRTRIYRQPGRLQFCIRDSSIDMVAGVLVIIGFHNQVIVSDSVNRRVQLPVGDTLARYALPLADDIDWMFIIKIIFSLFAIIFAFDAISRERSNGTLTLMCSNSVSRSSVLLGKYLGTCGTLLIPLMMGLALNLLIINVIGGAISLQTEHWLRMGFLILASLVYISLFVLLGLLISAIAHRSSTSLLILLVIWVAVVVIYPNLSGIMAKSVWRVDTLYEYVQKRRLAYSAEDDLKERIRSGAIRTQEEFDKAAEEAFSKAWKADSDLISGQQDALIEQCRNARRMTIVSPAAVYQYTGEDIADAGFGRQQRFLGAAEDYYTIFENYVRGKLGKIRTMPRNARNIGTVVDGKFIGFRTKPAESYEGDLSDFPHFTEPEWSVIDSLRASLNNLLALFLWNTVLFMTSYLAFIKRSLR